MTGQIRDVTAKLPAALARQCSGLGVDIGGSAVKIFYRTKEDHDALQNDPEAKYGVLHYLTCERPDLASALDSIRDKIHLTPGSKAHSCGIGGFQFRKQLQDAFCIEIEQVNEGDCLVDGLKYYLKHVPESELIYPPLVRVINQSIDDIKLRTELLEKLYGKAKNQFFKTDFDLSEAEDRELSSDKSMQDLHGDDLYPCLIVHLGSNHGWLKLEKDGTPKFCETTLHGGRCFMGVGSLLTNAKSYDEFMDLAEKGDNFGVDQSLNSLGHSDSDDAEGASEAYKALRDFNGTQVAYSFGNAVAREIHEFRREDIALAWLLQHISEIVATTHHAIVTHDIKHVFVAGSLGNRELVREHFTRELLRQDSLMVSAYGKSYQPHLYFLKNGGHLCSTGAMLNSVAKDREESKS